LAEGGFAVHRERPRRSEPSPHDPLVEEYAPRLRKERRRRREKREEVKREREKEQEKTRRENREGKNWVLWCCHLFLLLSTPHTSNRSG